jgi:hypothetical protein
MIYMIPPSAVNKDTWQSETWAAFIPIPSRVAIWVFIILKKSLRTVIASAVLFASLLIDESAKAFGLLEPVELCSKQ